MELVIGSVIFVAVLTATLAIDEYVHWMDDYDEKGRQDREYQQLKPSPIEIEYRE